MASVWSHQESIDELKDMLLYMTFELESERTNAKEEMRKNEENIKNLLNLLRVTCRERDEARDQLQRLLNKLMPSNPTEIFPILSSPQPESPPMCPTIGNQSITESDNSLSETYNHHSHGSSTKDSLFDVVSSPDLSNMNVADSTIMGVTHQPFIQEYNGPTSMGKIDQISAVIDDIVKDKPLPQKGKLLQAVTEAGPLLQTLLVSGPLPQWRNPPPVQPFPMPPISIKGCDTEIINLKQNSLMSSYPEFTLGSAEIYSSPMLNFTSGSGKFLNKERVLSTGVLTDFMHDPSFQ